MVYKNFYVVKVPGVNGFGKTDGCKNSGNAILKELKNIHVNEQGKIVDVGLFDLEEIHLDNSDIEHSNELIYNNSLECFEKKPKIVFLGGDHSVSYSIGKAFLESCKKTEKEVCLIVFNARPNCMSSRDKEFPTYDEWLSALVEEKFPAENILLVGIRNLNLEELSFLKEHNIRYLLMNSLLEDLEGICDTIMEFSNGKELYVSVDISVIDPVFAPSTNHKEPGGLTSRQFLYLIQRINKINKLRAVDIVGINAEEDMKIDNLTIKLGAKILSELL